MSQVVRSLGDKEEADVMTVTEGREAVQSALDVARRLTMKGLLISVRSRPGFLSRSSTDRALTTRGTAVVLARPMDGAPCLWFVVWFRVMRCADGRAWVATSMKRGQRSGASSMMEAERGVQV